LRWAAAAGEVVVRRTLALVLLATAGLAVVPFGVVPASADVTNSWVGYVDGERSESFSGGPTPFASDLEATISFGGYRKETVAAATYDCYGDFIAATLDCTRLPATHVNTNSANFPAALHSDNFRSDDGVLRARFENGRSLACYIVDGPKVGLPEDQSAQWQIAGACTALL
jgi:hypothetical protein